jgi:DNA adenine methylase
LLPLVPEHQTFVEVFSGSAALFFAKEVSPLEVINDLHSGLVNFYRVLRDPQESQRFEYLINLTPFSREEFLFCRDTWRGCDDEVEKAYRWFVMMRQSYGGMGKTFGNSITDGSKGSGSATRGFLSSIERLPEIHQRLRGVQIENLDFRKLIEKYDRPTTFFYLDPPYVHSTRKSTKDYDHEMTNKDHEELIDILLNMEGQAMLSGYAHPIYERLERAEWKRHDFETTASITNGKQTDISKTKRVESVWLSPARGRVHSLAAA